MTYFTRQGYKKYAHEDTDLWLINSHNGIKEKGIKTYNY